MSEVEEVKHLLSLATFPGVKKLLENYLSTISPAEDVPPQSSPVEPAPNSEPISQESDSKPVTPPAKKTVFSNYVPTLPPGAVFVPINDFAWDQASSVM